LFIIAYTKFAPFIPDYVDGPELRGITKNSKLFYFYILLSFSGIIYAFIRKKIPLRFIVFLQIPIFFLISWSVVKGDISNRFNKSPFDVAPKLIHSTIPKLELSKMAFIADPSALGIQTLSKIYYDEPNISIVSTETGSYIDLTSYIDLYKWIVVFGDYSYNKKFLYKKFDGFSILKLNDDRFIDFRSSRQGEVTHYTSTGMGIYEPWGSWSNQDVVRFSFDDKLPQRFQVILNAFSYPDNVNDEFQICYLYKCNIFRLNEKAEVLLFDFTGVESSNTIEFKVKNPIDIGGRKVGLGFIEIAIIESRSKK
jgi:hypothetical protein